MKLLFTEPVNCGVSMRAHGLTFILSYSILPSITGNILYLPSEKGMQGKEAIARIPYPESSIWKVYVTTFYRIFEHITGWTTNTFL